MKKCSTDLPCRNKAAAGRRSGAGSWCAALAVALAVQALFWLPLEYREERSSGSASTDNISILTPRNFRPAELRRFASWLDRHDPATFSRSDAPSGYAAALPESKVPEPAEAAPASTAFHAVAAPSPRPFVPLALPEKKNRTLLYPSEIALSGGVKQASPRSRHEAVIVTDGSGRRVKLRKKWEIPAHHTALNATVLRFSGLAEAPCLELVTSCGDEVLDTLAMRQLNGRTDLAGNGGWLLIHWRLGTVTKK